MSVYTGDDDEKAGNNTLVRGIDKDSDLKRELLLGIYIAAMGAYVLPFKGIHLSSIAIISGIMEASGLAFDNTLYLAVATLVVLAFTSQKSRAPKAEGIPYDKGQR